MPENKIKDLSTARRHRGAVCASITKYESRIERWEAKCKVSATDRVSIQCHIETLEAYNENFKSTRRGKPTENPHQCV